jgi:hypothetical protein
MNVLEEYTGWLPWLIVSLQIFFEILQILFRSKGMIGKYGMVVYPLMYILTWPVHSC